MMQGITVPRSNNLGHQHHEQHNENHQARETIKVETPCHLEEANYLAVPIKEANPSESMNQYKWIWKICNICNTRRPTYGATKETPCDQHRFQDICGATDLTSASFLAKLVYQNYIPNHSHKKSIQKSCRPTHPSLDFSRFKIKFDPKWLNNTVFCCVNLGVALYTHHLGTLKAVVGVQTIRSFLIPGAKTLTTDQSSIYGQWFYTVLDHALLQQGDCQPFSLSDIRKKNMSVQNHPTYGLTIPSTCISTSFSPIFCCLNVLLQIKWFHPSTNRQVFLTPRARYGDLRHHTAMPKANAKPSDFVIEMLPTKATLL